MLAAYYADRIITCFGSEGLIANHAQIGVSLIFKCYSSVYHFVVSLSCHCCFLLDAVSVYIQKVFRNARWLFNTPVTDIPRGYDMVPVCC